MDEKKKRLLELIELLKFPLLPEESKKQAEGLSEEELDSLLETYEAIWEYEVALNKVALEANPQEYKKVVQEENKEILDAEIEYADKMEEAQKEADEKIESVEEVSDKKIDDVVSNSKKNSKKLRQQQMTWL